MLNLYRLLYQISPIFLTNGSAAAFPSNMLPLVALLDADAFTALYQQAFVASQMGPEGVVSGVPASSITISLDNAFAIFQPVPGGTLIEQAIAEYPFANLNVAANAIIRNPNNISLLMMTPMKTQQAWALKLATMTALKNSLDVHNNLGGTYTVFTPAWTYTNMLMKSLTDTSTAQSPLPQNTWRWDFTRPLVSMTDIEGAESNLFNKITNGVPTDGTITSIPTAIGNPANVLNFINTIPSIPFHA
jgi:hypothetical protein